MTSSNKSQKHKCVDLSDYNIYWTKFDTELQYHTINIPEWWNSHSLKIQDGGRRHLGFLGYVKIKNANNSGLDKKYMHQILRDNALDIGLYNNRDHGVYGSTSCSHSLNGNKLQ